MKTIVSPFCIIEAYFRAIDTWTPEDQRKYYRCKEYHYFHFAYWSDTVKEKGQTRAKHEDKADVARKGHVLC